MKKILMILLMAATCLATANAQSDLVGGGKVKKEKKTKMGIALGAGSMGYSADQYSVSFGFLGSINFIMTMPFNKNPESRWLGEMTIGLNYCKNNVEWDKSSRSKTSTTLLEIPNIGVKCRYILNPMSTRGKWYIYPGISFCPLATFPVNETSSVNKNNKTLADDGPGLTFGGECGFGFAAKHLGFSVGPFIKIATSYSSKSNSTSPAMYGGQFNLHYMF